MTEPLDASLPDLGTAARSEPQRTSRFAPAAAVMQIPVTVQVVIGSARVPLSQLAELSAGAIVKLDQKLGAPALMLVNGREIARGQLFVLGEDEPTLGITITEVITSGTA